MVGTLETLDSISHLFVTDEIKTCILTLDSPFKSDEKVDMEITKLYKHTSFDISLINNSPFIEIDVYPKCYVKSSGKHYDYTKSENIKKLEEATNKYIEGIIRNYLYKITKNYNSDIAAFGERFTANFLTLDEFEKIHWNSIFSSSFYKVNVHTKITSSKLFNKR